MKFYGLHEVTVDLFQCSHSLPYPCSAPIPYHTHTREAQLTSWVCCPVAISCMFKFPKHISLLALLNSPYLSLLLTNFCALCLFHCCHITVVCHLVCCNDMLTGCISFLRMKLQKWFLQVPLLPLTSYFFIGGEGGGGACLLQQRPLLGPSSFLRMIHEWIWRVGGKIIFRENVARCR
jgi:hypothetical protein